MEGSGFSKHTFVSTHATGARAHAAQERAHSPAGYRPRTQGRSAKDGGCERPRCALTSAAVVGAGCWEPDYRELRRSGRASRSLLPWQRPNGPSWGKAACGTGDQEEAKSAARWRESSGEEASTRLNREACGHCSSHSAKLGQIWVQATDFISTLETSLFFAPPSVFTVNRVTDPIATVEDKPYLLLHFRIF